MFGTCIRQRIISVFHLFFLNTFICWYFISINLSSFNQIKDRSFNSPSLCNFERVILVYFDKKTHFTKVTSCVKKKSVSLTKSIVTLALPYNIKWLVPCDKLDYIVNKYKINHSIFTSSPCPYRISTCPCSTSDCTRVSFGCLIRTIWLLKNLLEMIIC